MSEAARLFLNHSRPGEFVCFGDKENRAEKSFLRFLVRRETGDLFFRLVVVNKDSLCEYRTISLVISSEINL